MKHLSSQILKYVKGEGETIRAATADAADEPQINRLFLVLMANSLELHLRFRIYIQFENVNIMNPQ